jgi:hypothetical protein
MAKTSRTTRTTSRRSATRWSGEVTRPETATAYREWLDGRINLFGKDSEQFFTESQKILDLGGPHLANSLAGFGSREGADRRTSRRTADDSRNHCSVATAIQSSTARSASSRGMPSLCASNIAT